MTDARDSVNCSTAHRTAITAMGLANSLGDQITEGRIAIGEALNALAVTLRAFCDLSNIRSAEVMQVAQNIIFDGIRRRPEFLAIHEYLKHEVYNHG